MFACRAAIQLKDAHVTALGKTSPLMSSLTRCVVCPGSRSDCLAQSQRTRPDLKTPSDNHVRTCLKQAKSESAFAMATDEAASFMLAPS